MGEVRKVRLKGIENRTEYIDKLGVLKSSFLDEYESREKKIKYFKGLVDKLRSAIDKKNGQSTSIFAKLFTSK